MIRVVLDTNVWVSAFLFGGKPAEVVQWALKGKISVALSPALKEELESVLAVKFHFPQQILETMIVELNTLALFFYPTEKLFIIREDPADNRVLECAIAAKAQAIVSGDKHLLNLRKFREIFILSPADFLSKYR